MLPVFVPETVIDQRYRVVRELGRGGFGVVLLCEELVAPGLLAGLADNLRDVVLRPVALKVLQPDVIDLRRFATEVRALCRLNHPGIVRVYHYGVEPLPYLAMEYVAGAPLDRAVLPTHPADRLRLLARIAEALQDAHAHGVVHRDLKPQNVLVGTDGAPRIVDFGLSMVATADTIATLTRGSPGWMAPELLEARRELVDHRVDIYALGALIYFVFAGRSPFSGDAVGTVVRRQIEGDWSFPDGFPEALRELVASCLALDPRQRPASSQQVAEALRALRDGAGRLHPEATGTSQGRVSLRDSIVRASDVVAQSTTREAARIFAVTAGNGGSAEAIGLFAFRDAGAAATSNPFEDIASCWVGATFSAFNAAVVEHADGRRFLRLDGHSSVVLDPYLPVTATDVSKVAGVRAGPCPTRAMLDDRKPDPPRPALVVGAIAHEMLERIALESIDERDRNVFNSVFDKSLAGHRLEAAAAGMRDAEIEQHRADLRRHFAHLGQLLHPERGVHRGTVTEARRISATWGLEGRIDLALLDGQRFKIIELKTGKRHDPAHVYQLRCYLMMWAPWAARRNLEIEGHLLYSQTGEDRPLSASADQSERDALHARNTLVAARRALSHNDTRARAPRFGENPTLCHDAPCEWRRRDCDAMCRLLGGVDGVETPTATIDPRPWGGNVELGRDARRWYAHFDRLIEREYRAVARKLGELGRPSALDDRVRERDAIAGITLVAIDPAGRRVWAQCQNRGSFMAGDDVLLHRADLDHGDVFGATIDDVLDDRIVLRCVGAAALKLAEPEGWVLSRETPRIGFRDMRRALTGLMMRADRDLLERIVRPESTLAVERAALERSAADAARQDVEHTLNPSQRLAVALATGSAPIALVHGPPGTGKTSVIAEIVARCVARGEKVLLAACTNSAVDHALAKVLGKGVANVLRVGRRSRASSDLLDALRAAGVGLDRAFSEDLAAATPALDVLRERIRNVSVVAATANACMSSPVFEIIEAPHRARGSSAPVGVFDVAIVDEASQLTEPLSIAPLVRARRVVFVGDARQLPPVVTADDARSTLVASDLAEPLTRASISGLDRSLFERLQEFAPGAFLAVQYRMSRAVQAFASHCFYEDRLLADDSVAARRLRFSAAALESLDDELRRRLDAEQSLVWVDLPGATDGHVAEDEVDEVVRTAVALFERREQVYGGDESIRPTDLVGVISPFRAQCAAIRAALRARLGHHADAIEVDTVERFQGREKEVMLVSLVRATWSDFVMDPRRINVTFTRARSRVVVFGPRELGRRMVETFGADRPATE